MDITVNNLKQLIQSSHVNFLYGSGLSRDYLPTLGNIEKLMSEIPNVESDESVKEIMRISLCTAYFKAVMRPCLISEIKKREEDYIKTLIEYVHFLKLLNHIMVHRDVNLIDKQVNLFTTNIDDFMEKAAEESMIEFNDGFKGHINPVFDEGSFSNIILKSSSLYQNTSAIPTFKLFKMHGSINWEKGENSTITYNSGNYLIYRISSVLDKMSPYQQITVEEQTDIEHLKRMAEDIDLSYCLSDYDDFSNLYSQLAIVNPSKAKFSETVTDYHFYELMRMYSNALERSSSLLLVAGFSFADEHIASITSRAANANPTLQIIVFAYDDKKAKKDIESVLKPDAAPNRNITVISPEDYIAAARKENSDAMDFNNLVHFDLKSINEFVLSKIVSKI